MLRYDSVPSLPSYASPSFGGDSYRPDRDRDRELSGPVNPPMAYHERDRLGDRDFYRSTMPRASPSMEFDRYRGRPNRPSDRSWGPTPSTSVPTLRQDTRPRDREYIEPRLSRSVSETPVSTAKDEKESVTQEGPNVSKEGEKEDGRGPSSVARIIVKQEESAKDAMPLESPSSMPVVEDIEMKAEDKKTEDVPMGEPGEISDAPETVDEETGAQPSTDSIPDSAAPLANDSVTDMMKTEPPASVDQKLTENQPPFSDEASFAKENEMTQPAQVLQPPVSTENVVQTPVTEQEGVTQSAAATNVIQPVEAPIDKPDKQNVSLIQQPQQQDTSTMTQEQIVERIDQIETDITMYEDMLENLGKQPEPAAMEKGDIMDETMTEAGAKEDEHHEAEEAKHRALQAMQESSQGQVAAEVKPVETSPLMRKRPQLLIDQVRAYEDNDEDQLLCEEITENNRQLARESACMLGGWQGKPDDQAVWSDEEQWSRPLYASVSDCPLVQRNIEQFAQLRITIADTLAHQHKGLKRKERMLKREYKTLYERWKEKNIALDSIRDHERRAEKYTYRSSSRRRAEEETDELVDGVIFNSDVDALRFEGGDGASTPYSGPGKGPWTSDAARSEAELLEIIQSLESADMRNPELRAAKTTATIPAMILDPKARMRTYNDRSGLVKDPLTYYHTGPDTGDVWTQQEMTAFMEGYIQNPKQFGHIAAMVGTKTAPQCVLFYYRKKKKIDFKSLLSKGRRGKAGKRRDRLAAAVRRATGASNSTVRKGKSKGSALMTDIGEAQVSRKAKEKETERRRAGDAVDGMETAGTPEWSSGVDRRRNKPRNSDKSSSAVMAAAATAIARIADTDTAEPVTERKRPGRRKGRSPRGSVAASAKSATTSEVAKVEETLAPPRPSFMEDQEMTGDRSGPTATARWTEKDKDVAVEAFKIHGRNFTQVAAIVSTKTEDQCRNFYHNYKRKFGPNVFDEESAESSIVSDIKAQASIQGQQLKADEEDAAAALVGLFQMGSGSVTPSERGPSTPTVQVETLAGPGVDSGGGASTAARRRRVRSASGKADGGADPGASSWSEQEIASKSNVRKAKHRIASSPGFDGKRTSYSSYWSVSEKGEFVRLLEMHGRDWDKIADAMKSKTAIQVRNFYANNEEKMGLAHIAQRYEERQRRGTLTTLPPMGTSFESSIHGPRKELPALDSFPFSSPQLERQTPQSAPCVTAPQDSYFTTLAPPQPHPMAMTPGESPQYPEYNRPTFHAFQPPPPPAPTEPRPPASSSATPSVTKVADLLNSEETAVNTPKKSWETWFGA
ncbi:uncharacterized protein BYT42DRAFT_309361 [Radiomyces spectabilis]|uniref:uncharacterized protein n=1 Tax=Radiomyces spectabilis TaxID=64574 RepID=UPI00222049AC|nr:uncharacterized protein BYT42DRAFT_309361 [Radiomyces spectabilis]KAI8381553.1 hypothetical protein BYT42DRAFT_309361 [Radiomyces spectabilis]